MTIKVGLIGVGKMGKIITRLLLNDEELKLVMALGDPHAPELGKDMGLVSGEKETKVIVESSENLLTEYEKSKPDVIVDFTIATATTKNIEILGDQTVNYVIGTTGLSQIQKNKIQDIIKKQNVGAVIAPNMSVGVNSFFKIAGLTSKMLGTNYDIEIVEAHHRFKKDAPSGTALRVAEILSKNTNVNLTEAGKFGRQGHSERKKGDIGIHAIRAGDIVGEHKVIFSTIGETIEVTHKAHSREAFATGVIKAIKFIQDKTGIYSMDDVLGL